MTMRFEWDEGKRRSNLEKHGVDFSEAVRMLSGMPWLEADSRRDYGERRCRAVGWIDGEVLVAVFTIRQGAFRIISARRANARERGRYAQEIS